MINKTSPALLTKPATGPFRAYVEVDEDRAQWPINIRNSSLWQTEEEPSTQTAMARCELRDKRGVSITEAQIKSWIPTIAIPETGESVAVIAVFATDKPALITRLEIATAGAK